MSIATAAPTVYLTPEQVCEIVPGMTKGNLAQLRFKGTGPRYYKPTPRVVLYREEDIAEWIESSARTGTADGI
ncbi:MAG: helix-turn-helix transcriptional regulator [Microbacterium gubbeenense]